MSHFDFDSLVHVREEKIITDSSVLGPFVWIKTDHGAWDGPLKDWEQHKPVYQKFCRGFNTVICAGGNQGMYPLFFSEMFAAVYTFEPDPLNFHCLVNNCQKDNVIKINGAVGEENGMCIVNRTDMTNVGMHTVKRDTNAYIPISKIDNLAVSHCDLIQLDVEGYELNALIGATRIIQTFKPVIACERGNEAIEKFLAPYGYQVVATSGHADTIYATN